MGKVVAQITTSVDGFSAGPDDGPGRGLGVGGERLHYWVFGGPWSYDSQPTGEATGVDREFLSAAFPSLGAVICGRSTYEAAEAWGGTNPWDVPLFVVTHRPEDAPSTDSGFTFVDGFDKALAQARAAAGDGNVVVMGGADVIRQALRAGVVDEFTVTVAPVVLGGGKRLFDGFDETVGLEQVSARQSQWATHLTYKVLR